MIWPVIDPINASTKSSSKLTAATQLVNTYWWWATGRGHSSNDCRCVASLYIYIYIGSRTRSRTQPPRILFIGKKKKKKRSFEIFNRHDYSFVRSCSAIAYLRPRIGCGNVAEIGDGKKEGSRRNRKMRKGWGRLNATGAVEQSGIDFSIRQKSCGGHRNDEIGRSERDVCAKVTRR